MPLFENSQNTNAQGTFNDVGRDQVNNIVGQVIYTTNLNTSNADSLELLRPIPEAMYNSIECHVSGCLAGTRQEVIRQIVQWVDGTSDQPICWLHGAAGYGKSAISKSIADLFAKSNRLAGSFFFFRGAGRRSSITHFISTLAYNLASSLPATRPHIGSALRKDYHILCRSLEHQFEELITEPIRLAGAYDRVMVVIVDALDECDDKGKMAQFIEIVALATRSHQLPLRFFFTSRVEEHIQKKFSTLPALQSTFCLALEEFNASVDIRTFYLSRFSTMYLENRRVMRGIELPWPSKSVLTQLVHKSSGSFIFAFTLINFVNGGSDLPHRKLQAALEGHAGLDPLYAHVLRSARRSPHFLRIFETIMTIKENLSISDLACLLQVEMGDVVHALLGVQSILVVPEDDVQPVRPFHTSLRDFLTIKSRSNELFINPVIRHLSITSDCLATIAVHTGDDFFERGGLKFACRSWSPHFLYAIREEGSDDLLFSERGDFTMKLTDFVSRSFDSWVNSIISQHIFSRTMNLLDSILSVLRMSHRCPLNIRSTFEKIRTIAESDVCDRRT